jgi:hypothetical protein
MMLIDDRLHFSGYFTQKIRHIKQTITNILMKHAAFAFVSRQCNCDKMATFTHSNEFTSAKASFPHSQKLSPLDEIATLYCASTDVFSSILENYQYVVSLRSISIGVQNRLCATTVE